MIYVVSLRELRKFVHRVCIMNHVNIYVQLLTFRDVIQGMQKTKEGEKSCTLIISAEPSKYLETLSTFCDLNDIHIVL